MLNRGTSAKGREEGRQLLRAHVATLPAHLAAPKAYGLCEIAWTPWAQKQGDASAGERVLHPKRPPSPELGTRARAH